MKHSNDGRFQLKLNILTFSIGLIFFYFGILKFFPNLSPAEQIGSTTVCKLCFNLISPEVCLILLAILETLIGIGLMTRKYLRFTIFVAIAHMAMTFTPIIFFSDLIFQDSFISPTLLGQYIYKNIIIICALAVVLPARERDVKFSISK